MKKHFGLAQHITLNLTFSVKHYVGKLGALAEPGMLYNTPATNQSPFFERLGLKYKFTENFALQIVVRAHIEKADMVEWGAEYCF